MTLLNKAHLISTCADPQGPGAREDERPLLPGTSFITHFAYFCTRELAAISNGYLNYTKLGLDIL